MREPFVLHLGDCREVMASLPDESVDAIVTDPPYGLEFMGKDWDSFKTGRSTAYKKGGELKHTEFKNLGTLPSYTQRPAKRCSKCGKQAWSGSPCACPEPSWEMDNSPLLAFQLWCESWAREALRVLKPGGHLLAFGGSRTYHRLACAIEDAGFEIRDQIMWVYGSGFPKSLDVSKAIDKAAGVAFTAEPASGVGFMRPDGRGGYNVTKNRLTREGEQSDAAREWDGWGTALKPAHEPIVVARKPLIGTVAANVLAYGTGALNIDACRVGSDVVGYRAPSQPRSAQAATSGASRGGSTGGFNYAAGQDRPTQGRWPANLIHDGDQTVLDLFPDTPAGNRPAVRNVSSTFNANGKRQGSADAGRMDSGSAARFFYCAKASKRDRDEGLEGFEAKPLGESEGPSSVSNRKCAKCGRHKFEAKPCRCPEPEWEVTASGGRNHHPTVKPTDLMRYLVRLVTPPGGVVLDPFTGSGSTGKAAMLEGFRFIGIEQDAEYLAIARARIGAVGSEPHARPEVDLAQERS